MYNFVNTCYNLRNLFGHIPLVISKIKDYLRFGISNAIPSSGGKKTYKITNLVHKCRLSEKNSENKT